MRHLALYTISDGGGDTQGNAGSLPNRGERGRRRRRQPAEPEERGLAHDVMACGEGLPGALAQPRLPLLGRALLLLLLTSLANAHKPLAGTASPELMALLQRATEMRPVDWRNVTDDEGRMRLLFGSSMNGCLADLIAGLWIAPGGDAARDIEQRARLRLVKSVLMGVGL